MEVQVSEQRGKANMLLTHLPFVTIHAGLGAGKAAELISAFSGVSLVNRLLLGMDMNLADLPVEGFSS